MSSVSTKKILPIKSHPQLEESLRKAIKDIEQMKNLLHYKNSNIETDKGLLILVPGNDLPGFIYRCIASYLYGCCFFFLLFYCWLVGWYRICFLYLQQQPQCRQRTRLSRRPILLFLSTLYIYLVCGLRAGRLTSNCLATLYFSPNHNSKCLLPPFSYLGELSH